MFHYRGRLKRGLAAPYVHHFAMAAGISPPVIHAKNSFHYVLCNGKKPIEECYWQKYAIEYAYVDVSVIEKLNHTYDCWSQCIINHVRAKSMHDPY